MKALLIICIIAAFSGFLVNGIAMRKCDNYRDKKAKSAEKCKENNQHTCQAVEFAKLVQAYNFWRKIEHRSIYPALIGTFVGIWLYALGGKI